MTDVLTLRVFFEAGLDTGEGPIWDARTQTLYCVDSTNPAIWSFAPDGTVRDRMALPERVGFLALTEDEGTFVAGLKTGLFVVRPKPREVTFWTDPEPDLPGNRINDGIVDRDGSLIFGSLDDGLTEPTGRTHHLRCDGTLDTFDDGYVVSNGPFPLPGEENRVLFIDSVACALKLFRRTDRGLVYDRPFCEWDEAAWGLPDGVAVDVEGGVWVAHWSGSRVTRFDAGGHPTAHVDLPVSQVTKPAFGGADRRTLYVTTANRGLALGAEPLAGSIFAFPVDIPGIPPTEMPVPDL